MVYMRRKVILDASGHGFELTEGGMGYLLNSAHSYIKNNTSNKIFSSEINIDYFKKNIAKYIYDFNFRSNPFLIAMAQEHPEFIKNDFVIQEYIFECSLDFNVKSNLHLIAMAQEHPELIKNDIATHGVGFFVEDMKDIVIEEYEPYGFIERIVINPKPNSAMRYNHLSGTWSNSEDNKEED